MLAVPRCSGGFSFRTFLDRWAATAGRSKRHSAKGEPSPSATRRWEGVDHEQCTAPAPCRRACSATERRPEWTGLVSGNPQTTRLDGQSAGNQRLVERLEAENARLRSRVVDLMLQIQALLDGASPVRHRAGP